MDIHKLNQAIGDALKSLETLQEIVDEYGGIPFIKQCIIEGKSQQQIADEIGRDRTLIQKYLKSRGTSWKELKKEI